MERERRHHGGERHPGNQEAEDCMRHIGGAYDESDAGTCKCLDECWIGTEGKGVRYGEGQRGREVVRGKSETRE